MANILSALAESASERVKSSVKDAKEHVINQFDPRKSIYQLGMGIGPLIRETVSQYKKQQASEEKKTAKGNEKVTLDIKNASVDTKKSVAKMAAQLGAMNAVLSDIRKINIAQLQAMKGASAFNKQTGGFDSVQIKSAQIAEEKQDVAGTANAEMKKYLKLALGGIGLAGTAGYAYNHKEEIEKAFDDFLEGAQLPKKEELTKKISEKMSTTGEEIADWIAKEIWTGTKALGVAMGRSFTKGAQEDLYNIVGFEQKKDDKGRKTGEYEYTGKFNAGPLAKDVAPWAGAGLGYGAVKLLGHKFPLLANMGLTGLPSRFVASSIGAFGGAALANDSPIAALAATVGLPAAMMYYMSKSGLKGTPGAMPGGAMPGGAVPPVSPVPPITPASPAATSAVGTPLTQFGTVGAEMAKRRAEADAARQAAAQAASRSATASVIANASSKVQNFGKNIGNAPMSAKVGGLLNLAMALPTIMSDINNGDYAAASVTAAGAAASLAMLGFAPMSSGASLALNVGIGVGTGLLANSLRTPRPTEGAPLTQEPTTTQQDQGGGTTPTEKASGTGAVAAGNLSFVPQSVLNDAEFMAEVDRVSKKYGIKPEDLLAVMKAENSTFSPSAKNPNGTATGLIQFTAATAKTLKTSIPALASMTRAQQMKYVDKYFEHWKLPYGASRGQIYTSIFKPAALKTAGNDSVLYRIGQPGYDQNMALDKDGNGNITVSELDAFAGRAAGSPGGSGGGASLYAGGGDFDLKLMRGANFTADQLGQLKDKHGILQGLNDLSNAMAMAFMGGDGGGGGGGGTKEASAPAAGGPPKSVPSVIAVSPAKDSLWWQNGGVPPSPYSLSPR